MEIVDHACESPRAIRAVIYEFVGVLDCSYILISGASGSISLFVIEQDIDFCVPVIIEVFVDGKITIDSGEKLYEFDLFDCGSIPKACDLAKKLVY